MTLWSESKSEAPIEVHSFKDDIEETKLAVRQIYGLLGRVISPLISVFISS